MRKPGITKPNEESGRLGGMRRVLAVVAADKAKAGEMARRFAAAGDVVEAVWYRDFSQLREKAAARRGEFEAVVWFGSESEAEAAALREWLGGTPLIEAA